MDTLAECGGEVARFSNLEAIQPRGKKTAHKLDPKGANCAFVHKKVGKEPHSTLVVSATCI